MTNQLSELHLLLSRTSQEYRRGLHKIIGAPPGDSPGELCSHLAGLRANASRGGDLTNYKQLVTDIADQVGFDWTSIVERTPWPELSSEQIEAAIVRHVEADKMYREDVPTPPPDGIAALDNAFSSLSGDWRKLLATVIYIHQVIRPSAPTMETSPEPEPVAVPMPASGQQNGENETAPAANEQRSSQPSWKSGAEPVHGPSGELGPTLLDFWRWSGSDLTGESTQAALAAYIVSSALGLQDELPARNEAAGFLLHSGGLKIEVTSAFHLPSDRDDKPVDVRFLIRANWAGEAGVRVLAVNLRRRADVYVFCLLAPKDEEEVNPLNVAQWQFYVVPSSVLDEQFPLGKSVPLQSLQAIGLSAVDYEQLSGTLTHRPAAAPGWKAVSSTG